MNAKNGDMTTTKESIQKRKCSLHWGHLGSQTSTTRLCVQQLVEDNNKQASKPRIMNRWPVDSPHNRTVMRKAFLWCDPINRFTQVLGYYYNDVTMSAMASQVTSLTIVYWTFYSDGDQRKHQSSASLAFVRGIHRWPVNSPHKWPVTRKMFPFYDVIMTALSFIFGSD